MRWLSILFIVVVFTTNLLAVEGWEIVQKNNIGEETIIYTDGRKWSESEGSGIRTIVDYTDMTIAYINENNHTYWKGKPEDFVEAQAKLMQETLEKSLERVPPEMRDQMKAMMGMDKTPVKAVFVKKGDETIFGINVEHWVLKTNSNDLEEIWVSQELPFWQAILKNRKKVSDETWKKILDLSHGVFQNVDIPDKYIYIQRDYYTVKRKTGSTGELTGLANTLFTEEMKSFTPVDIDPAKLDIPAGYKQVTMKEMMTNLMQESE